MAGSHDFPDTSKDSAVPPIAAPSSTAQRRLEALLSTVQPPVSRYGRPIPNCWVPMQDQPLRHPRKLRVVTIGAAISAMNMAYEIQYGYEKLGSKEEATRGRLEEVVEHCIYESNEEIGGTWLVNTYPGVACDVPAHIYTCTCRIPQEEGVEEITDRSKKSRSSRTLTGPLSMLVAKKFTTISCEPSKIMGWTGTSKHLTRSLTHDLMSLRVSGISK